MTNEVKVLTDDEVAEIEAQLATIIDPLPPVQRAVALCYTARAAWADRNTWQQIAETLSEENTALREQLAQSRAENERLASQLKQWQEEKDTKAGYL